MKVMTVQSTRYLVEASVSIPGEADLWITFGQSCMKKEAKDYCASLSRTANYDAVRVVEVVRSLVMEKHRETK